MKTAGIVVDDYKLKKFKKELTDNGLTDFTVTPYTLGGAKDTSLIKVIVPDDKVKRVYNICQKVEMHFKQSN